LVYEPLFIIRKYTITLLLIEKAHFINTYFCIVFCDLTSDAVLEAKVLLHSTNSPVRTAHYHWIETNSSISTSLSFIRQTGDLGCFKCPAATSRTSPPAGTRSTSAAH